MSYQTKSAQSKSKNSYNGQSNEESSYIVIASDQWDLNRHNFGLAKPNKSGQGKSAPFTYDKKKFFLKVPKLYCPFGASTPKISDKDKEKQGEKAPAWSLQMAFTDSDASRNFQNKVNQFDQLMIDQATKTEYQNSWLGTSKSKPWSKEVIESKYNPMLKHAKKNGEINDEYPPFIRAQLPTTFNAPISFTTEVYDENNNKLEISNDPDDDNFITKVIPPGCKCAALLSGSIWANVNGFGVTWRITQIKLFPKDGIPKGQCMLDDPVDEDEEEEKQEISSPKSKRNVSDYKSEKDISSHGDEEHHQYDDENVVEDETYEDGSTPKLDISSNSGKKILMKK